MTVTLDLKPETRAAVLGMAQTAGMSLEAYLLKRIESAVPSRSSNTLSLDEDYYAVSRESMYEDRDLG